MNLRDVLGVMIVAAFALVLPALFMFTIPEKNADTVTFMLGQLSGFVGAVVGFHYSASKSDDAKTENTGRAFEAITAVAQKPASGGGSIQVDPPAHIEVTEGPAPVEVKPG